MPGTHPCTGPVGTRVEQAGAAIGEEYRNNGSSGPVVPPAPFFQEGSRMPRATLPWALATPALTLGATAYCCCSWGSTSDTRLHGSECPTDTWRLTHGAFASCPWRPISSLAAFCPCSYCPCHQPLQPSLAGTAGQWMPPYRYRLPWPWALPSYDPRALEGCQKSPGARDTAPGRDIGLQCGKVLWPTVPIDTHLWPVQHLQVVWSV